MTKEEIKKSEEFIESLSVQIASLQMQYNDLTTKREEIEKKFQQMQSAKLSAEEMLKQMQGASKKKDGEKRSE